MFFKREKLHVDLPILIAVIIYAYFINWYSGNIGVLPIDSFSFLDSGNSILQGHLPIRDFWAFTGVIIDYIQSIFFLLFGNSWNSYLAHSSFMNTIATTSLFFFLKEFNLKLKYVALYCISFATLCYPISGTPFHYIHAYIFSLISIFCIIIAIKNKNKFLWFSLPFISLFAFLSMQTPTAYILIIFFFFLLYYFLKSKDFKSLKFFFCGVISSLVLFSLFIFLTRTPLIDFFYQYLLFPISIGEARMSSDSTAYVRLVEQLNLKRIFGEFKFIHIFLLPLILISLKNLSKNRHIDTLNLIIILSCLAFFFNQLLTANQIYIFSLIPLLAATLQINLNFLKIDSKYFLIIILIVLFTTTKYHLRFNLDKKFHDLESTNKAKAVKASEINKNFNNLKWISSFDDPKNEIKVIKAAVEVMTGDNRNKTLLTHYHFMSLISDQKFNMLNRWYLWSNDTHPTENHKYYKFYRSFINKNLIENKIEVIYLLGQKNEINFENVKNYFEGICFENKVIITQRFSSHKIVECK